MDDVGRSGRPRRVLAVVLLAGAVWLAVAVLVWVIRIATGRADVVPWLPLTVLAAAVPAVQARAALSLLRSGSPDAVGLALGTVAGLAAVLFPLATGAAPLAGLQPALAAVPVLVTVVCAAAGVVLLVRQHGLRLDRLAGPPSSLATSASLIALVWVGLALIWATPGALVAALPGVVVVPLAALGGPAGYRTGLMLGWCWGLAVTGGSLLVAAAVLALGYRQAWSGLVIVGVAAALAAAWLALRSVPAGR